MDTFLGETVTHHGRWLVDQVAKITLNCPITLRIAKWSNGQIEYRVSIENISEEYNKWRAEKTVLLLHKLPKKISDTIKVSKFTTYIVPF